jgi:CRP/FNR family transcriptional activator FtrB
MAIKGRVDLAFLRSLPLLGSASGEHAQRLAAAALRYTAPSHNILFAEGDRVHHLFVLVRGTVELFSEQDERRLTISVVRAAHTLQVCSILAERHPLSARVLESSELVSIPAHLIVELLSRDAAFADAFARKLAKQSLEIIEDFKKHRLLNSTARIAHWMLEQNSQSGGNGQINIPFDKRVLASYLGMTPEQLSRGFAMLASSTVVKVDGRFVSILDAGLLTRIAHREEKLPRSLTHATPFRPWRERGQRL